MPLTAFAATADYQPGGDLSISIEDSAGDIITCCTSWARDGRWQPDRADSLLAEMGYGRTGPWDGSGGQWGAFVEPA